MGVAPQKPAERVLFYVNKCAATGAWKLNAAGIGSSPAQIDSLSALALAARAALAEQQATRDAAKTATQNARQAVAAMSLVGSQVISAIHTKALVDGPEIYTLADVPEPATPSPVAAPGTPTGFSVELIQGGALKLSWACQNPKGSLGTLYVVQRRIGVAGTPAVIGTTGKKFFTDSTLTAGAAAAAAGGVTYAVTAQRSTKSGNPGQFTVDFGVGAAGEMTATVSQGGPSGGAPKLAA